MCKFVKKNPTLVDKYVLLIVLYYYIGSKLTLYH